MKITKIIINNKEIEVEAYINISKKEIRFVKSKFNELIKISIIVNSMNQKKLNLKNEKNVLITLYDMSLKTNRSAYIYSFRTILIGAKNYDCLNNITFSKVKIMFQNTKRIFKPHSYKTINISNTCDIKITNNHIFFSNCNLSHLSLKKIINNLADLLYFITGKNIIIKEFAYINAQTSVIEHCDEKKYYKIDILHDHYLVDINDINNLTNTYENYMNLVKKVDKLPIQAFFIAKDNTNISELKLVSILQSLDGLCQHLYNDNISLKYAEKEFKSTKEKIKEVLNEILDKDLLDNVMKKIGTINGIEFKDYINYITCNTTFGKIIFNKEHTRIDNCEKYYDIDTFKQKSINERNRFSHMNNTKKNYLTSEESEYFYLKYKLAYRCCILTSIGLNIKNEILIRNSELIPNVFPNISNKCYNCKIHNKTCNY